MTVIIKPTLTFMKWTGMCSAASDFHFAETASHLCTASVKTLRHRKYLGIAMQYLATLPQ